MSAPMRDAANGQQAGELRQGEPLAGGLAASGDASTMNMRATDSAGEDSARSQLRPLELRNMSWRDLPQVMALEHECFPRDAWSLSQFWSELAGVDHDRRYVVLCDVEDVVAYAGVRFIAPEAEILTIAVDPDYRGFGAGRRLVAYLEAEAAAADCDEMHLEVAVDNESAHGLYAAVGYADVGTRVNYYGIGRDAILMSKALAQPSSSAHSSAGPGES